MFNELKTYIMEDKLKEALRGLMELAKENGMINTIIILSGRYRELEVAINRGREVTKVIEAK